MILIMKYQWYLLWSTNDTYYELSMIFIPKYQWYLLWSINDTYYEVSMILIMKLSMIVKNTARINVTDLDK